NEYKYDFFPSDEPPRNHEPEKQVIEDNQEENRPDNKELKVQKNKQPFFQYLIAGVIGGVITASIIVILLVTNVIPTNSDNHITGKVSADSEEKANVPAIADLTSSDAVNPATIDELSKAVVGIIN